MENADGSVDIYFGPTAPKGVEKNRMPTVPNRGWFAYFRLYAPLEAYFNQSWPLPDIEEVKRTGKHSSGGFSVSPHWHLRDRLYR